MTRKEIEEFKAKSPEEKKADLLDSMSDAVSGCARKLMMMKAMAKSDLDLAPEDFDQALERELKKQWDKVKDKDSYQLAIMGLLDMMADGTDIEELLKGAR